VDAADAPRFVRYDADVVQPLFPVIGDHVYVPAAARGYAMQDGHFHAAAPEGAFLLPEMETAVSDALAQEGLAVVAVEPWVYGPYRLVHGEDGGLCDAQFFWTRADFVGVVGGGGGGAREVVVGDFKGLFGSTTQDGVLAKAEHVRQVVL